MRLTARIVLRADAPSPNHVETGSKHGPLAPPGTEKKKKKKTYRRSQVGRRLSQRTLPQHGGGGPAIVIVQSCSAAGGGPGRCHVLSRGCAPPCARGALAKSTTHGAVSGTGARPIVGVFPGSDSSTGGSAVARPSPRRASIFVAGEQKGDNVWERRCPGVGRWAMMARNDKLRLLDVCRLSPRRPIYIKSVALTNAPPPTTLGHSFGFPQQL